MLAYLKKQKTQMAGSSRQKLIEFDTKLAYISAKYHCNIQIKSNQIRLCRAPVSWNESEALDD